jgi:hypothetical protein
MHLVFMEVFISVKKVESFAWEIIAGHRRRRHHGYRHRRRDSRRRR